MDSEKSVVEPVEDNAVLSSSMLKAPSPSKSNVSMSWLAISDEPGG